jgi:hypothetical protein
MHQVPADPKGAAGVASVFSRQVARYRAIINAEWRGENGLRHHSPSGGIFRGAPVL